MDNQKPTPQLSEHQNQELHTNLRNLPELEATAAATLPGEKYNNINTNNPTPPGSRPPLNLTIIDLTRRTTPIDPTTEDPQGYSVLTTLESWTRVIEAQMLDTGQIQPDTLTQTPTVKSECTWLLQQITWITEQNWAPDFATDISRITHRCKQALHIRPEYRPKCQRDGCTGLLTEHTGWWACPKCGQDYRDKRMTLTLQQPMTAEQIANTGLITIKAATIRKWRERGHLTPIEDGPRPKYSILDVLQLADPLNPRD